MIGSGRGLAAISLWPYPLVRLCVQLMQVIEVVLAVAAPEDVDLFIITVCGVHVAGTGRDSLRLEVEPHIILEVENVHIFSRQRSLAQPSADYVQLMI